MSNENDGISKEEPRLERKRLTPCLPGMVQCHVMRLTEPSGSVSGFATKPQTIGEENEDQGSDLGQEEEEEEGYIRGGGSCARPCAPRRGGHGRCLRTCFCSQSALSLSPLSQSRTPSTARKTMTAKYIFPSFYYYY